MRLRDIVLSLIGAVLISGCATPKKPDILSFPDYVWRFAERPKNTIEINGIIHRVLKSGALFWENEGEFKYINHIRLGNSRYFKQVTITGSDKDVDFVNCTKYDARYHRDLREDLKDVLSLEQWRRVTKNVPDMKTIDDLVLNQSQDYFTVCKKNEQEGIERLRKFAKTATFEEAWAYLPKQKEWIEIGEKNLKRKSDGTIEEGVTINNELYRYIIENHGEIVTYHIHPTKLYDQVMKENLSKLKEEGIKLNDDLKSRIAEIHKAALAIPSYSDIFMMISRSCYFYQIYPDGKKSYKICSETGITEFSLTKKGFEYFQAKLKGIPPNKQINYIWAYAIAMEPNIIDKDRKRKGDELLRYIHGQMNNEHMKFSYTAFKK